MVDVYIYLYAVHAIVEATGILVVIVIVASILYVKRSVRAVMAFVRTNGHRISITRVTQSNCKYNA